VFGKYHICTDRRCAGWGAQTRSSQIIPGAGKPVHPFRHGNLEPGTSTRRPGLGDRHARQGTAFPDEEKPEPDVRADHPVKPVDSHRIGIPPGTAKASYLIDFRKEMSICNAMLKKNLTPYDLPNLIQS